MQKYTPQYFCILYLRFYAEGIPLGRICGLYNFQFTSFPSFNLSIIAATEVLLLSSGALGKAF